MHDARLRWRGATEHAQQARLPGAVAADETDLVAGADGEADVLDEETPGDLDREATNLQHPSMLPGRAPGIRTSSVHLTVAALPVIGAQFELLELPGRGTRKDVAELDRRRALEM